MARHADISTSEEWCYGMSKTEFEVMAAKIFNEALDWSRRHAALKKFAPDLQSLGCAGWQPVDALSQPQAGSAAKSTPAAGADEKAAPPVSDPAPFYNAPFGPLWRHMPKHDEWD